MMKQERRPPPRPEIEQKDTKKALVSPTSVDCLGVYEDRGRWRGELHEAWALTQAAPAMFKVKPYNWSTDRAAPSCFPLAARSEA
jgi:hypothetical protein